MTVLIIALTCVVTSIGIGISVSRNRFCNKISDAESKSMSTVAQNDSLVDEIGRYEQLKHNLIEVKENIEKLEIPIPEALTTFDDTDSSLNKLSSYFEKHSTATVGTEAFILSILPVSQTGEALCSFASVAPDLISDAFSNSLSALKDGITVHGVEDITNCLSQFCEGMTNTSQIAIAKALEHHNYMGALLKPIKSGFIEISGLHDATDSLTESFHDMGDMLSNAAELSIDPTDMTDLDFSGHIPVITIAISSFRELNLLVDRKTDTVSSLKNIALDAVGAGGGGLVGAKAGALAGSIFGPVGTLLGGIVGGIGGAMGGRKLTNEIKRKPLNNAIEAYQSNANRMKVETKEKSRNMLKHINEYASGRRNAFKNDKLLVEIPVVENEDTVLGITLIIYQAINEHIASMKENVSMMKSSIWYSEKKYGIIVSDYEKRISDIEKQLPITKEIEENPMSTLNALLEMKIPSQKKDAIYQIKFNECAKELKEMNDKNNSSILVWSYMVNGLYQKTLNEIANFSNNQMTAFNDFVAQWKNTMSSLENKIIIEKNKLGLT